MGQALAHAADRDVSALARSRRGNKPAGGPVDAPVMERGAAVRWLVVSCALAGSLVAGCERKPAPSADANEARPATAAPGSSVAPGASSAPSGSSAAPSGSGVAPGSGAVPSGSGAVVEKVEVPEVRVRPDADTTVRVTWVTPDGTAVNDEAPFRVRWNRSDGLADAPSDVKSTGSAVKDGFQVTVRPMAGAPNATLGGEINIVVCDAQTHSVCVPVRRSVELGFIATKDAAAETTVAIPLPAAK